MMFGLTYGIQKNFGIGFIDKVAEP